MAASEFEYRHRFWMIVLVYVVAYACYNLDHLNVLYSIVPWNQGSVQRDLPVRFLYGIAALVAAAGALLLTWATAYRPHGARTVFSTSGPFRYVRNPHYISYFLLIIALGTFQSRLGFPVMLFGEIFLLLRLVGREELLLDEEHGDSFRAYALRVPRFFPSLHPDIAGDGPPPQWRKALWEQVFQWGFVATLLAFAFTLSDFVGYALAGVTLSSLILQKLVQPFVMRFPRT